MRIGFVGAGRMAQALGQGFIAAGITKGEKIIASCPPQDSAFLEYFGSMGCQTSYSNAEVVQRSEVVVLAVKPPIVPKVLQEIASIFTPGHLMVSIALGIPIRYLEQMLPRKTRVVRVMPNTPALVKHGASVFSCGSTIKEGDSDLVKKMLTSVGICEEVPETLIDAATGLSGSGPAYMYIAIDALADGGVKMGLPRDLAIRLAAQTLLGAGKMVLETGRHPGALKDDVCSPAGSSIHAVQQLERHGLRTALIEAVQAAALRSEEAGLREKKS
ncbi:pyrroline-5-carboxylate reductase 1, mitochondrial-like isoform X1 [Tachypleus tridentatus]|uniref:pyrroline-5-carboxylate reductase 1, mitochondrial-like isoform X1 n=1 Tax=Tachypleus tridentatus TaxID=6853 RepID=UPI003FD50734